MNTPHQRPNADLNPNNKLTAAVEVVGDSHASTAPSSGRMTGSRSWSHSKFDRADVVMMVAERCTLHVGLVQATSMDVAIKNTQERG